MSSRSWKVLCWNVRGINSKTKWDAIRDIITESCPETKRESFDLQYLKKFCPSPFDSFVFLPSVGTSVGIITIWKSHLFDGTLSFMNEFAIVMEFISRYNNEEWLLNNVYGPCTSDGKRAFTVWLKNIQMPEDVDWPILGDFNLIWHPENRNHLGGDVN
jgi:hypothetical protein